MRILVADDDLVSRLVMADVLRQCGAPEIVLAEDGESAWRALTGAACFDLICLDVRMPPPDGLALVKRLRAAPALRRVPAMLISASADRSALLGATPGDLQGVLVKPVGADAVARVGRVLAQLDAAILEPADAATARLRIDGARHARYVAALLQQVQALAGLAQAQALASADVGADARAAFVQRADTCRTAALTLGSPRIEQLISDALASLAVGQAGTDRSMRQAVYWLARVAARPA